MFTSDKAADRTRLGRIAWAYLLAAVICALFGAVYELFGHGVYAYGMIYAFAFPLLLGLVPCFLLGRAGRPFPAGIAASFIHAGVAALTAGSLVQGALEIYGTTNPLTKIYWIAGLALIALGWLTFLLRPRTR